MNRAFNFDFNQAGISRPLSGSRVVEVHKKILALAIHQTSASAAPENMPATSCKTGKANGSVMISVDTKPASNLVTENCCSQSAEYKMLDKWAGVSN